MATHSDYKIKFIQEGDTATIIKVSYYEGEFQDLINANGVKQNTYVRTVAISKIEYKFDPNTPLEKIKTLLSFELSNISKFEKIVEQDDKKVPDIFPKEKKDI